MLVWSLIVGFLAILAPLSEGRGLIQNVAYNVCLYGTDANNGALGLVACDKTQGNQNWSPAWNLGTNTTAGTIILDKGQRCLTVLMQGLTNGAPIDMYDCWYGAANQKWNIISGSTTGQFQIQSVQSGRCLTAENWAAGITATYLDQWDCGPGKHQFWYINDVAY